MGKTTNVECKVDWKTVLVFVSIAFSSQCGGGFASGSTPWTYFFRNTGFYGMLPVVAQPYFCLFMPFIVAVINCFIIYFFMKFAMDFRTFDYSNFLRRYGSRFCNGIFARPMQYIYEFNFNWLLIVCMALAYSTSGSALKELTGIPYLYSTLIIGVLMFVLCMKGTDLVRKNAVFMSAVIFIALMSVHVPNILYNVTSRQVVFGTWHHVPTASQRYCRRCRKLFKVSSGRFLLGVYFFRTESGRFWSLC